MPDKYDELIASEIDYRDEDYMYQLNPLYNDKEAQIEDCWNMKRREEEKQRFMRGESLAG